MTQGSTHVEEAIVPDEHTKLIICFDGTGNTFSGTNADTNVVKILRKLNRNHPKQFHYYQSTSAICYCQIQFANENSWYWHL